MTSSKKSAFQEKANASQWGNSQKFRNIIDGLRAVGVDKHVELPQIAVMGDTSSGKSSVLSAISGIAFPSNSKLTTRCPTQLILSTSEDFHGTVRLQRYQVTGQAVIPPVTLESVDEIADHITHLTQILVDEGQSISDDAIVIEVSGPSFPNLTLTDLPGLVRTVADSDDPNIIVKIRKLLERYLVQKRTVILCVVPANGIIFHF
jgi:interferon-induced GTP-binding protein Mx1